MQRATVPGVVQAGADWCAAPFTHLQPWKQGIEGGLAWGARRGDSGRLPLHHYLTSPCTLTLSCLPSQEQQINFYPVDCRLEQRPWSPGSERAEQAEPAPRGCRHYRSDHRAQDASSEHGIVGKGVTEFGEKRSTCRRAPRGDAAAAHWLGRGRARADSGWLGDWAGDLGWVRRECRCTDHQSR